MTDGEIDSAQCRTYVEEKKSSALMHEAPWLAMLLGIEARYSWAHPQSVGSWCCVPHTLRNADYVCVDAPFGPTYVGSSETHSLPFCCGGTSTWLAQIREEELLLLTKVGHVAPGLVLPAMEKLAVACVETGAPTRTSPSSHTRNTHRLRRECLWSSEIKAVAWSRTA